MPNKPTNPIPIEMRHPTEADHVLYGTARLLALILLLVPTVAFAQSSPNWATGFVSARIITPMDFGAKGDGTIDDTAAVQAAINATSAAKAPGMLYLAGHKYCITGVTISSPIRIIGSGYGSDNGQSPSGFTACSANPSAMITLKSGADGSILEDFGIFPGTDGANAASGSAIVNKAEQTVVRDVLIRDACNAITDLGNANKYMDFRINGTALRPNCSLVTFGSSTVQSIDPYFVMSTIDDNPKTANTNTYGIQLINAGGFYIAWNDVLYMDYGMVIDPSVGKDINVSGGFVANTVLGDTVNAGGLNITGNGLIYELSFIDDWIGSAGNESHTGKPLWVGATALNINGGGTGIFSGLHFSHMRIEDSGGIGLSVGGPGSGGIYSDITFDNSTICGASNARAGTYNVVQLNTNATSFSLTNSIVGQSCDNTTGTAASDVNFGKGTSHIIIIGNQFLDNSVTGTPPSSGIIVNNTGLDDKAPSVASAATITAPFGPLMKLTGTTTVTTINGGWPGRTLVIINSNGAALAVRGNIIHVPFSFSVNQRITCTYLASAWACS